MPEMFNRHRRPLGRRQNARRSQTFLRIRPPPPPGAELIGSNWIALVSWPQECAKILP